jgi:hypothetical protein
MKPSISIVLALCAIMPHSAFAQTMSEKAEKRLAELLAPSSAIQATLIAGQPRAWRPARSLDDFSLPITPYAGGPVHLPRPMTKDVKPRSAPEGLPLVAYRESPMAPAAVELPTQALIRLPSVDVHAPLPIPILAQPTKDRASLGDPTLEASLDAALTRFTPTRDRPVPFMPINLPDPFEHVRYGQLRHPPEESATPPTR